MGMLQHALHHPFGSLSQGPYHGVSRPLAVFVDL